MLSSILAFIKAKAVIVAITSTVVVTTAVATPIVINEVKKQNQNAEVVKNQVETVVSDNTEEKSDNSKVEETKEEITMGEAVDKELIDSDDPEAWKTDVNVKTPAQKEDEKKMQEAVEQANKSKEFRVEFLCHVLGGWVYISDSTGKLGVHTVVMYPDGGYATRDEWLNGVYQREKQRLIDARPLQRQNDIDYGLINSVDINQINSKIKELTASRDKANRALAYMQSNEIVANEDGVFVFEGVNFSRNVDDVSARVRLLNEDLDRYKQMKNEYNPNEIGPNEQRAIDALATLETAYNYIKTH